MKLPPASANVRTIRPHSSSSAPQPQSVPKVIVPRQSSDTRSPLRPNRTKRMGLMGATLWRNCHGVKSSSMSVSRTSPVELLLELAGPGPRTKRLEQALREAVRDSRLRPGTALPSSRVLARELGVSRGVVGAAYAQLGAEGYLVVHQGAAVRVADVESAPPVRDAPRDPTARYNLRPDLADYASFPRREWLASLRAAL